MKRYFISVSAIMIILVGFVFASATDTVFTVVENEKAAYGSCDIHTYEDEYTIISESTCSSTGTKYRNCSVCSYIDYVETSIAPDNHTELDTDWTYYPEATCIVGGVRYHVCRACGAHVDIQEVPADAQAHKSSGTYEIITQATCISEGEQAEVCVLCGELFNNSEIDVDSDNHTVSDNSSTVIVTAPTCAEEGQAVTYCDDCGASAVISAVAATGNHVPGDEVIIDVAPTCSSMGQSSLHCTICDTPMYIQYTEIDPDAHEYSDYVVDIPVTCMTKGEKSKYCVYCNDRTDVTSIPIDPQAHEYGDEWIITKESTCSEMGLMHKVCKLCSGSSVSVLMEKSEHTYGEDYVSLKVSADGLSEQVMYTCQVCGYEYVTIITYSQNTGEGNIGEDPDFIYFFLNPIEDTLFVMDYENLIISNVAREMTLAKFNNNFKNSNLCVVYDTKGNVINEENIVGTGYRVNYDAIGGVVTNYYISVTGDIDSDGKISAADARLALRAAANIDTLTGVYSVASDVNSDGKVSAADARQILRVAANLEYFKSTLK